MLRALDGTGRTPEDGFTLIELMVTSSIMLVVLALFLGLFEMLNVTEVRVTAASDNQTAIRLVIDQLQRDIDSANPLDASTPATAVDTQIEVKVGSTYPGSPAQAVVQWAYDPTAATLTRSVVSGPNGASTAVLLRKVSSFALSYFNDQDVQFVGTDAATLSNIQNCTIRIHVTVTAAPAGAASPFTEDTDMQLRNRLPGGIRGCV